MVLLALFILLMVLVAIDCLQTLTIASRPSRWHERNPWLRAFIQEAETSTGKRLNVICYFTAALAVMGFALQLADAWLGNKWACITASLFVLCEMVCVINNYLLGIEPFDLGEL